MVFHRKWYDEIYFVVQNKTCILELFLKNINNGWFFFSFFGYIFNTKFRRPTFHAISCFLLYWIFGVLYEIEFKYVNIFPSLSTTGENKNKSPEFGLKYTPYIFNM